MTSCSVEGVRGRDTENWGIFGGRGGGGGGGGGGCASTPPVAEITCSKLPSPVTSSLSFSKRDSRFVEISLRPASRSPGKSSV